MEDPENSEGVAPSRSDAIEALRKTKSQAKANATRTRIAFAVVEDANGSGLTTRRLRKQG